MAEKQADIGIWGPTKAGKTTYLAGLLWAIDKFAPGWQIWPAEGDRATEDFFLRYSSSFANGVFPPSTPQDRPFIYNFRMSYKDNNGFGRVGRYHEITVLDVAGEYMNRADDPIGYYKKLRKCKGILCMIDPEISQHNGQPVPVASAKTEDSYISLLIRMGIELHQENGLASDFTLNKLFAFTLTKMDLDQHWPYRQTPQAYMYRVLGEAGYNRLIKMTNPQRREFFAISVVGQYRTLSGEERPNIEDAGNDSCRIADLSQWTPYKLLDPLFWLFDKIEAEESSRLPFWRRIIRERMRVPCYRPSNGKTG